MDLVKDMLVDGDGDLGHYKGDFLIAESDLQHIRHIVFANPGDYKQSPIIGFGVTRRLNSPFNLLAANSIKADLTLQLTADGYKVRQIKVGATVGELQVKAER